MQDSPFAAGDPDSIDQDTPKRIAFEDCIMRQLERIAYRRSMNLPWAEALYQLRDMLVGMEDAEFWDGVPPDKRKEIADLPPEAQKRAMKEYAELGWATHKVRAFKTPRGPVFRPTSEQLSKELRMLMRLLDRRRMIRKTRRASRLPEAVVKPHLVEAPPQS